jgi:transposase
MDVNLFIKKLIYDNPFITRQEVKEYVYLKFNIKLSLHNISKIYKFLNMSRKKPKYHIVKSIKFLDEIIEKRKIYLDEINKVNNEKIISIDEAGFNKIIKNNKGLSTKGTKINMPIKQKLNKNISLLLAVTIKGILHFQINKENTNSAIFFKFIKEIIEKLTEKNYVFIFDNICFHRNKEMLNYIILNGHQYKFSPPYSPNNNPIENVFSIIKNKYNKIKYTNQNKIEKKIENILITPKNRQNLHG